MKAFFPKTRKKTWETVPTILLGLAAATISHAQTATEPVISGPWTQLRQAPVFEGEIQPLAPNWGPALPLGQTFHVEKVYGRWLYGTPEPLARMPSVDLPKPAWVFSRMLLVPGDSDTLSPALAKQSRAVIFHSREVWKKFGVGQAPLYTSLDFLESLTLSRGTTLAFRHQDEKPLTYSLPGLSLAYAAVDDDEKKFAPLGLTGSDLGFLDQEFRVIQNRKNIARKKRESLKLRPPGSPPLDSATRTAILGRMMLQKYLALPPLTHEEVDGHIYMRATAMRALEGCAPPVRDYWKNRRWNIFRVFHLKSRPELRHPWLEVGLPGGYFAFSGKSMEVAGNEAELAFLLVRPLVRELRVKRPKISFKPKAWPGELPNISEEVWAQALRAQSTKDSENLDVADEIAVDLLATECIARAGYRSSGGLSYLRKLSASKEEPWAKWFIENSIGLEYRLERLATLVEESLAQGKFPAGVATNPKRFATASRHWNLLP